MVEDYEEIKDVLQDYKIENDGIWQIGRAHV